MMTETEYERIFIDGCSGTVPNNAHEALLYKNLCEVGVPEYTDAEWSYAEALKSTYDTYGAIPSLAAELDTDARETVKRLTNGGKLAINNFIAPLYTKDAFSAGSTDVGDVSWQTPAAQLHTACFTSCAPGHSWQNVSAAKSSIGHKGMLLAGKVIAATAVELFENEELIRAARAEFERRTAEGYDCPIPDGECAAKSAAALAELG